jgi:trimethylamine--corrinoid protein Co-methyltransferase
MSGTPGGQIGLLGAEDVCAIIDAAWRVLGEAGVQVNTKTGREAFAEAGAEIDGNVVRIPRDLGESLLGRAPSAVTLYSRDGSRDCTLEAQQVHMGTGGTALYVIDPETDRHRESTVRDVAWCARLCDALEQLDIFTINVFPNEIESTDQIDANRFYWSLQNTGKHVMAGIYSAQGLREVIEMAQMVAGGAEKLRARPFVSFITLVISPLKIDDIYGEMTCICAREGLPVVVPTEPLAGTTSPVTPAANILMHVAETIAGVMMVQAVNPGAPAIAGSVGSTADMRTLQHLSGPIERGIVNAGVAQVIQALELPLYSTAGTSDAKTVDAQAAFESALSNMLVMMSGANYIHDSVGLMDFDLTVAYEKMVIDNEIIGMVRRVMDGVEVSEETLATDLICERGPGEGYMAEEHTVRHMREGRYLPAVADRTPRAEWAQGGCKTATDRARARALALIGEHRPAGLSEDLSEAILERFPHIRDWPE